MFGTIFGMLCLFGLVAAARGRWLGRFGYAHRGRWCRARGGFDGFDHSFEDEPWEVRRRRARGGTRQVLHALYARLDTTPSQEKAIAGLLDQAQGIARDKRAELRDARRELAAVFARDLLERDAVERALTAPRVVLDALQRDLVTLVEGLHDVLDDRQRHIVAALIVDGSVGRGPRYGATFD